MINHVSFHAEPEASGHSQVENSQAGRETEDLLERVFSSIHLHVAFMDRNFNFIRVNQKYAEWDHHTTDFYPGKNHFELYPDKEYETIFRQVVETGVPYSALAIPLPFPESPEQVTRYWDMTLEPTIRPNGEVTGLVLTLLDVTSLHLARQALNRKAYLIDQVNDAILGMDDQLRLTDWNQAAEQIYGWTRAEVVGQPMEDLLHTRYKGATFMDVLHIVETEGVFQGEAEQQCKSGTWIPMEIKITRLRGEQDQADGYLTINREIANRRKVEAQISQANRRMEALAELTHLLADANLNQQRMMEILAARVSELIGDACVVTLLSANGQWLNPVAYHHPNPEIMAMMAGLMAQPVQVGEGLVGRVAQVGLTLRETPAISHGETAVSQTAASQAAASLHQQHHVKAYDMMIAPLMIRDRVVGTLGVSRDQPGVLYTTEDQTFLEALANRAALWIANAELFAAAQTESSERRRVEQELSEIQRRLLDSVETERLELARELHDGPIQELYGLSLQLAMLDHPQPDENRAETVVNLQTTVQRLIESLRSTALQLRPPTLSRFGLAPAIRSYSEQIRGMQPGLQISLHLDEDPNLQLSERQRLTLYRIYQISIVNVVRHAHAQQARVHLWQDDTRIGLEIEDDGVGFQMPQRWVELARQGHLGLVGAIERVEALGGNIRIQSQPGAGTRISVTLLKDTPAAAHHP
jgi:PAS domain S-box-containing protein